MLTLSLFWDEMICYENYYGKLYKGVDKELMNRLTLARNVQFFSEFDDPKILGIRSDGIGRDIVAGFDAYINGTQKKKFRLFSGHDTGVYAHMILLKMMNMTCLIDLYNGKKVDGPCEEIPGFASQFIHELAIKDGSYYVRTLFNNVPILVCDVAGYCKYEEWKDRFSKLTFMEPK